MDGTRVQRISKMLAEIPPLPDDAWPFPKASNVVSTFHMFPKSSVSGKRRKTRGPKSALIEYVIKNSDDASRIAQRKAQRQKRKRAVAGSGDKDAPRGKKQRQENYRLDLMSLVREVPATKYEEANFSTAVMRACGQTTSLVFKSANVVNVNASSSTMGLWSCHIIRLIVERCPMVMRSLEDDRPILTTLEGRMQLSNWSVQNIVSHQSVGHRINLKKMHAAQPEVFKYDPGMFPGLILHCKHVDPETKKTSRVKCIVFDSGQVLIVGTSHIHVSNQVFISMKKMTALFKDHWGEAPRSARYQKRLDEILCDTQHLNILKHRDMNLYNRRMHGRKRLKDIIAERTRETQKELQVKKENEKLKKEKEGPTKITREQLIRREEQAILEENEERFEYTFMAKAAIRGMTANVEALLNAGQDPSKGDNRGNTVLQLIEDKTGDEYDRIRAIIRSRTK